MITPSKRRIAALGLLTLTATLPASAWVLTINNTGRSIFMQVGNGSGTVASPNGNSSGADNATINIVSVTVPSAALIAGGAQAMTTNSTQTNSFYDNYAACPTPATQLYVGGYFRGTTGTAVMAVTAPANLTNGANTIPFNQISWTASDGDIPSGTFIAGGTRTLRNMAVNRWVENCHTFSYANSTGIVGAGTYTGRVSYTITLP